MCRSSWKGKPGRIDLGDDLRPADHWVTAQTLAPLIGVAWTGRIPPVCGSPRTRQRQCERSAALAAARESSYELHDILAV